MVKLLQVLIYQTLYVLCVNRVSKANYDILFSAFLQDGLFVFLFYYYFILLPNVEKSVIS